MAQTSEELKTLAELHEVERAVRTLAEHQVKRIGELERSKEEANFNFSKLEVKLDNLKNDMVDFAASQKSFANQLHDLHRNQEKSMGEISELKDEVRGISQVLTRSFQRESRAPESSQDQPMEEQAVRHLELKNPEVYRKLEAEEPEEAKKGALQSFKFDISEEGLQVELRNYNNAEPQRQWHFLMAVMVAPAAFASTLAYFSSSLSTLTSVLTLAFSAVGVGSVLAAISLIKDKGTKRHVKQQAMFVSQVLSERKAAKRFLGRLSYNIVDSAVEGASADPKTE